MENGTALPASSAKLGATVPRPNGDKQKLTFDVGKDSAREPQVVVEPPRLTSASLRRPPPSRSSSCFQRKKARSS